MKVHYKPGDEVWYVSGRRVQRGVVQTCPEYGIRDPLTGLTRCLPPSVVFATEAEAQAARKKEEA